MVSTRTTLLMGSLGVLWVLLGALRYTPKSPTKLRPLSVAKNLNLVFLTSVGKRSRWKSVAPALALNFPDRWVVPCKQKQQKHRCIRWALSQLNPESHVIWANADIVFSNWTEERIIATFESFETEIVISAGLNDWPSCRSGIEAGTTDYHYDMVANGAFLMGRAKHLESAYTWIENDDQIVKKRIREKDSVRTGQDEFRVQRFWLEHRNDPGRVRLDYDRKLVVSLSDWAMYHVRVGGQLELPWYHPELCGELRWRCFEKGDLPCWTWSLHGLCAAEGIVDCSRAYEVDGCRVYQKGMSRGPVSAEAERRALEGVFREELLEFLPELESFAYHGNGGGEPGSTFLKLKDRVQGACVH
eukprot:Polyplicarium_translucidae@DN3150_c1_g1_i4.p1